MAGFHNGHPLQLNYSEVADIAHQGPAEAHNLRNTKGPKWQPAPQDPQA